MKKKFILFLTCIMLFSLAGCGGSSDNYMGTGAGIKESAALMDNGWAGSAPQLAPTSSADMSYSESYSNDTIAIEPELPSPDTPYGGGEVLANSKIIYSASLDLETREFDSSVQSLSNLVSEMGGYFEYKDTNNYSSYRSLNCRIRVPVEKFNSFLDKVGETAHVTRRNESLDDISETYYDQEARLTTQRTKLDRLHELLSQAENMEDIITLESAISDTELEIEYLTGKLRKYDSLIGFSTIDVYLSEVYRLSNDDSIPETFGERFSAAISLGFRRGVEGIEDFTIGVAQNWLTILMTGCIIIIIVAFIIYRRRKKGPSQRHFSLRKRTQTQNNSEK